MLLQHTHAHVTAAGWQPAGSKCMLSGDYVIYANGSQQTQVHFHLEVVAGAVHVLQQLTPEPIHVYLPEKV